SSGKTMSPGRTAPRFVTASNRKMGRPQLRWCRQEAHLCQPLGRINHLRFVNTSVSDGASGTYTKVIRDYPVSRYYPLEFSYHSINRHTCFAIGGSSRGPPRYWFALRHSGAPPPPGPCLCPVTPAMPLSTSVSALAWAR